MTTGTQVIAHRGASRAEMENTVAAFRRAVRMGAQSAELDVRRTADGVLVVHHNPTLEDSRVLATLRFDELPEHVCTLDEALDACAPMWVNVETNIKASVGCWFDRENSRTCFCFDYWRTLTRNL